MRVGLIGLGVMGYRIGANLARAGKLQLVYNRTREKADRFSAEHGVEVASTVGELVEGTDVVLTMLSDDSAVSSVIREALPVIKGKVIIDMSTISPTTSIGLADQVRRGGGNMMDAPVIGTSIHVEQKKIAVLVGGPRELFETAKDIIGATAAAVEYMGGNGMGLYAKLVNNLLLGAYVAAMGEAYWFGVRSGVKPEDVEKVLRQLSSARSPTADLKVPKIRSGDYSTQFALRHMRKDLEIVQRETQNIGMPAPMSSLALQLYRLVEQGGGGDLDFAAVAELFKPRSNTS
ncbi:3-hydroxyisobutyrate dehydrogenase [Thermocladium modestius]|uniref:3-hydroxyisobutyrate dehydrogenase n=1 Tax=Thermocladium modestius TaxID=62609 RepID=A0A830GVQ9_9CREN|nr:NAD(P)-dependent oxidoreductase [Thermocladium modestius]GGP22221.1 3-hydroxyisobutyrate dehydrogenase [Thermocladium modestius]